MRNLQNIGGSAIIFICFALMNELNSCTTDNNSNKTKKLNVLFIAVDDLRPQFNCYGISSIISPNIDNLAKTGIVFNRAYCQMASCGPSRASLLTSRRPDVTRVYNNSSSFRDALPDIITLPQQFKNQGYYTQSFGKVFHGTFEQGTKQDPVSWTVPEWRPKAIQYFTDTGINIIRERHSEYVEESGGVWKAMRKRRLKGLAWEASDEPESKYFDARVANKAIEVLNQVKDKPFFLAVGFTKPHLPFVAPAKYFDLYKNAPIEVISGEHLPTRVSPLADNWDSRELREYNLVPKDGIISPELANKLTVAHNACVSFVDAQIGKILDELNHLNLIKNTIIVFFGDHGFHVGQQGLWCKNTNFEAAARVPLIICYPHAKFAGKKTDTVVELLDLMPTLCELTEIPVPDGVQGKSLVPILEEFPREVSEMEQVAITQHTRTSTGKAPVDYMGYSIRTDKYRYTEWIPKDTTQKPDLELYDFEKYLTETVNVAYTEEYEDLKKQLSAKLQEVVWGIKTR